MGTRLPALGEMEGGRNGVSSYMSWERSSCSAAVPFLGSRRWCIDSKMSAGIVRDPLAPVLP